MVKRFIAIDINTNEFLMQGRLEYCFEELKEMRDYNTCKSRSELFKKIQEAESEIDLSKCILDIKEIYIKKRE